MMMFGRRLLQISGKRGTLQVRPLAMMSTVTNGPVRQFSSEGSSPKQEESSLALKTLMGSNFDEESKNRARQAYDDMMGTRTKT